MGSPVRAVMDRRLRQVLDLWRTASDDLDRAPLAVLADHAANLLIIEQDGDHNRYAHYGDAFIRHFGADLTGSVVDLLPPAILPLERRGMLEFEYSFARRTRQAVWRSYTADFGGEVQTWQRLVLPLARGRLVAAAYRAAPADGAADDDAAALLRLVIDRVPVVIGQEGLVVDLALSLDSHCRSQSRLAELEVLATRDSLTGVSNFAHFHRMAGLELDHARRMGRSFSVLALDIDHFKTVNDTWGHAAGDEALKIFVTACRQALREYDVLGRLGGEEFAVALPHTGSDGGGLIAERLRRQVAEAVFRPARGHLHDLTVSVGLTSCAFSPAEPGMAEMDIFEMLRRADAALYRAKAAGRNRVEVWAP